VEFFHGLLEHAAEGCVDRAMLADLGVGHAGVRARPRARESRALARGLDAGARSRGETDEAIADIEILDGVARNQEAASAGQKIESVTEALGQISGSVTGSWSCGFKAAMGTGD